MTRMGAAWLGVALGSLITFSMTCAVLWVFRRQKWATRAQPLSLEMSVFHRTWAERVRTSSTERLTTEETMGRGVYNETTTIDEPGSSQTE